MDFGGASTQITFETRDTIEDPRNEVTLKLYGQAYKVYTHSFLCYGRDQVLKRLLSKLLQVPACARWRYRRRDRLIPVFSPGCPPALALGQPRGWLNSFPSQLLGFPPTSPRASSLPFHELLHPSARAKMS